MSNRMKQGRIWGLMMVAIFAVAALGCGRRAVVRDGSARGHQRNLVRLAARATGCQGNQLQPTMIGANPPVWSVMGCSFPVEYWLSCRGRRCHWQPIPTLNEQAAAPLQCQPQMIQQQLTQAANMRVATGCGRQGTFAVACNGTACGWAMAQSQAPAAMPVPAAPPAALPPPQAGTAVTATAAPTAADQSAVNTELSNQREAILSCIDTPTVNLTVRWTADGLVQIQLPPELTGSAAEGCIQAAVGTLRITAQRAGQLTVPVQ